jgi:hypothetical protein
VFLVGPLFPGRENGALLEFLVIIGAGMATWTIPVMLSILLVWIIVELYRSVKIN